MKNIAIVLFYILTSFLIVSCSSNNESSSNISGIAAKGSFVSASTLKAAKLNADFSPEKTQNLPPTDNNQGKFSITLPWEGATLISISGVFFDEFTGKESENPITLTAITNAGKLTQTNINLYTHLVASRAKFLVEKQNLSLDEAIEQAEQNLQGVFNIQNKSHQLNLEKSTGTLDSDNANLLLFSGAFMAKGGGSDLLEKLLNDFREDGDIDDFLGIDTVASDALYNQVKENLEKEGLDTPSSIIKLPLWSDLSPPVISIKGENPSSISKGGSYVEQGAEAFDNIDGVVDVSVSGSVNSNIQASYTVTYTATDKAGNTSTQSRAVNVIAPPVEDKVVASTVSPPSFLVAVTPTPVAVVTPTSNLRGRIVSTSGERLTNVAVKVLKSSQIRSESAITNNLGNYSLTLPSSDTFTLVFELDGYASQVLPVKTATANNTTDADITLIKRGVKQAVTIIDAPILGNDGAKVELSDNNSFVDSNGDPVSLNEGIKVEITPVDISTPVGISAFPGSFDGIPEGSAGVSSPILSYGTVEYKFTKNGEELQLASGKTAEIEIPIYSSKHPNGSDIQVGDTIPLWSLNEETGIWLQEGTGVVVSATNSPTGFALRATVSHFTWWNCDVTMNPTYVTVSVFGNKLGSAKIIANTDGEIGWRSKSVNTIIPVGETTNPLAIPSNGVTSIYAEINYSDGTMGKTNSVVVTSTTTTVILSDSQSSSVDTLGLAKYHQSSSAIHNDDLTAYIDNAIKNPVIIRPTTFETKSTVTYDISGSLPNGIISTVDTEKNELLFSGKPTESGTFNITIIGTDSNDNTDTVILTYNIEAGVEPPKVLSGSFSSYNGFISDDSLTLSGDFICPGSSTNTNQLARKSFNTSLSNAIHFAGIDNGGGTNTSQTSIFNLQQIKDTTAGNITSWSIIGDITETISSAQEVISEAVASSGVALDSDADELEITWPLVESGVERVTFTFEIRANNASNVVADIPATFSCILDTNGGGGSE